MRNRPDPAELARYVRQRMELGAGEWVLDGLTTSQALKLAREAGARPGDIARPTRGPNPAGPVAPTRGRTSKPGPETGAEPPPPPIRLPTVHAELEEVAQSCTRCRLAGTRTRVVFADGSPKARLMIVGEAPGADEDRTGRPFVGRAGKLLDLLLEAVDLSREESVYISNVVKCRPPENRNPERDEVAACAPFLEQQIALVRPRAILAVGIFAGQSLTGTTRSMGGMRGQVTACGETPLVVTYHPAALLRNPRWMRSTWEDLQLLRSVLDDM